jgi:hypothetical protein
MVQLDRPEFDNIHVTRRMCFAFLIPKATETRSEYVMPISFLRQQCIHERAHYYVILQ